MRQQFGILAFVAAAVSMLPTVGCKSPAQAEAGVFTAEQAICMVAATVEQDTTGPVEQVAADIVKGCALAPAATQDVINFINAFNNLPPATQAKWRERARAHLGARGK